MDNQQQNQEIKTDVSNTSIDKTQISQILHIPQEVYERIVKNSFVPTQQDIFNFEKAMTQDDYKTMHAIAHRLKGTYSNLRIETLSVIAKEINEIVLTGQGKEKVLILFNDFKSKFEQIKKLFESP